MTLVTRVSLFFLGTLAVTLGGFSLALYLLVAGYLERQLDQRLESAMMALTASVEIKDDAVEWEPHERRLDLADVRWLVRAPGGRVVGLSAEPIPDEIQRVSEVQEGRDARLSRIAGDGGEPWRVLQARLEPARASSGDHHEEGQHTSLFLTVAASVGPMDASLRLLGWTLTGLSIVVWSLATLVGRWLCRRTLAPVARMADSARAIPATSPGDRLQVAATGDELEELGRSFNGLLDRLQEAFERQRRFTGEASHQLRTPLAVLIGQVEVARRRDRPPEEYRRVLDILAEQAGRLHRIIEMLLFLARADADAALPCVSPVALRPWLTEYLETWATHPRATDIREEVTTTDTCALAHAPLLGQVVDILLDNAMKYSPPGNAVVLSLRNEGERILLGVEDAGCGIDPEDIPHIFEPFFRSPTQRGTNTTGVGLGLSIARRIARTIGGEITADSKPGHGSQFVVSLACSCPKQPNEG